MYIWVSFYAVTNSKRQYIIGIFISILLINYIGTHLMYGLYMVDKDLFVEWFCENKDNPEMECDGSCMLHKIDDHDKHSSEEPILLDVFQVQLVFFIPNLQLEWTKKEVIFEKPFFHYEVHYVNQLIEPELRPPILV